MLRKKLLLRRLAYVPWLLAAGLVLGWAGEAVAQNNTENIIKLSVDKKTVREDAGETQIELTARAFTRTTNDDGSETDTARKMDADTYVGLTVSVTGLNSRFLIELPSIVIPTGKEEGSGMITFIPIQDKNIGFAPEDATNPESHNEGILSTGHLQADLEIEIGGNAGRGETVEEATITLIDDDKPSTKVNLTFSDVSLSKTDRATDIEVTATLDGKTLRKDLSFSLVIDEDYDGDDEDTDPDPGQATRDVGYSATLTTITIPDRKVSGRATITIRPKNADDDEGGIGKIWFKAASDPVDRDGMTFLVDSQGTTLTVTPNSIEITGDPAKEIKGLTAVPFSIREDAGAKEITLKVSLQNALLADETVLFTITDDSANLGADFEGAVDAERDVHYRADVQSLTILKGETEGMTTITVTPIDNAEEEESRAFKVYARIGGDSYDTGILITDDDTTSKSVTLEVSPAEIKEGAGPTEVVVTGILNGKEFDDDVLVAVSIQDTVAAGEATRDIDYTAALPALVIPAGSTEGMTTITITAFDKDGEEKDEKIRLISPKAPKAKDEDGDPIELAVHSATITLKDTSAEDPTAALEDPTRPVFAVADSIADQTYTAGTAIAALVLPAASGGTAPLTYSVSTLPAGLAFDAATRTLSGTPTAATDGAVNVIYTVIDSDNDAAVLIFSIAVAEAEPLPPVADAALTATLASIREDAEATQVLLTVTLKAAKAIDEKVTFTLVPPSEGTSAVRDVDYAASLGAFVTIPAGSTVGTTTLTLIPIDNDQVDSLRALGVQATFASGATLLTDIKIVDDETPSTSIALSASPHTISEEGGQTTVTVTATLDGKALAEEKTVIVAIDAASSTATRDVDYAALFDPLIVIPAGSITGSTQFAIRPVDDNLLEGNETITLIGAVAGLVGGEVDITLSDRVLVIEPDEPDESDGSSLAFADNTVIPNQAYTAGTAITPLVLPAASGGTPPLTYSISVLPTGLTFDSATRTISGTPATVDSAVTVVVIYTVIDNAGSAVALTFSITVNPGISFGDSLGDLFDFFGSGKIVPTASHDLAEIREFVVGQRVEDIVLPAASGGTAPLTYSLSPALPAGLAFDSATRTISGTPRAAAEAVYTYTVTDANGATASLALQTLPTAFSLADNFPNPFNPATTIQYALPQAADVELTVYNVVGQPVRTLVAEHQSAGRYVVEWDATDDSGHSLASGMYLYRLQVGGEFHDVKKMLLLK